MAKWKDKLKNGKINESEIRFGEFKLSVHRHIAHKEDEWFSSCSYLFSCKPLHSKDVSQAKVQAKAILQVILQDAVAEIAKPSGI